MRVLWLFLPGLLLVSCTTIRNSPKNSGTDETSLTLKASQRIYYSPEALGIQILSNNGHKIARWKEAISPHRPVEIALLPLTRKFATQPRIAGTMNGRHPVEMVLDTGAPICVVRSPPEHYHDLKLIEPGSMANTFKGLASEEVVHYCVIDQLQFGKLTLKNILAGVHGDNVETGVDNILGLSSLANLLSLRLILRLPR